MRRPAQQATRTAADIASAAGPSALPSGGAGGRLSLSWLLAIAFGGLVALSVGAVLALSVRANFVNTRSLLDARAVELIDGMERQIAAEAGQAERVVTAFAGVYGQSSIGMAQTPERRAVMAALLRTAPAVEGVLLFGADGTAVAVFRNGDAAADTPADASTLRSAFDIAAIGRADGPLWGPPVPIRGRLFHNIALALKRGEGVEGIIVAVVGQDMVSQIMTRLVRSGEATVFMLAETGEVVSHSRLPELFAGRDILPIGEFPDMVLRQFPQAVEENAYAQAAARGIRAFVTRDGRSGHIFLTKQLVGYSARPLTLGVYFAKADLGAEMLRAANSLIVGLAGLIAAVAAAILLGRRISRPMAEVALAAARFSDFRLDDIEPLPRSRIREIDDQAVALNRMRAIVLQFTRYVPRELVARLVRTGEAAGRPVEREVTILFSDIMGFTTLSERLNAVEIVHMLNRHFEMVTRHVEATGGTIDKFMGDGVMAFWGAPDVDPDHAIHAVRAAEAIVRSVRACNAGRRREGLPPLRVRMGLHTGRVVVGNIGGPDRQNYTIVGDPVNVAQRLEQLARDMLAPQDDALALVSSEIVAAVGDRAGFTAAGTRDIRGRARSVAVSVLDVPAA